MKILYLSNIPSPYVVDFLNELGKQCELTAVFERQQSSERNESWKNYKFKNFFGIILQGINIGVDSAISCSVIQYLKKDYYDHIIIANPCTPTGIIALEYMKLKKIPYIIESEGGFAKSGKGIKEKFKKQLMSGAYLYFSTCDVNDDYFLTYGAKKEKIVRFPFTTQYKEDILSKSLSEEEKDNIKRKLNFNHKKMILSIGRFIPSKGFDILLRACNNLQDDVGICIIGGSPPKEYKDLINELDIHHIYFMNHLSKKEIKEYYLAADIFILPTRYDTWGLVIIEAMSNGLPVISTNTCVAALAFIHDFENGFIIPNEDVKELEEKIHYLINNSDIRDVMANKNIEIMCNYTIEEMANIHIKTLGNINIKG